MQIAEAPSIPRFEGSDDEQQTAGAIFQAMRGMGRFFARTAPVRASVDVLAGFMAAKQPERDAAAWAVEVARVVALNPAVFDVQQVNGQTFAVTTPGGQAPSVMAQVDTQHTLTQRFAQPRPAASRAWTSGRRAVQAEAIREPEDVFPPAPSVSTPAVDEFDEAEISGPATPPTVEVREEVVSADVSALDDHELAAAIERELRNELSVANFGDRWMAEDKTPRLSRGDLRRIHDYIVERDQPLSSAVIVEDILNVRPGSDNYDLMIFGTDYRLSREAKEFEFVGTPAQHLWSTVGLLSLGTTKRKPSEIGGDYRYLRSEARVELPEGETVVEHVLTFYEYQYGVLPLDPVLAGFFPEPVLPDQRAAVLTFESPQNNETFLVELRYPSGNRGGYLAGFERFFLEYLVPGALFTIEREAGSDARYLIEFFAVSGQTEKLLQVDEKKQRYVFRPRTFYCATSAEMVLTENHFPQLANAAPLDDRTRRRPELTLAATFERVGEQVGTADAPRYMAVLDDLLAAANVERPVGAELIRMLASSPEHAEFTQDAETQDVFYYEPAGA